MAKKETRYTKNDPLRMVHFRCSNCWLKFEAEPGTVIDAPEKEHHPWKYFAPCRACGAEAHQQSWEQNMMAGWGKGRGPKTAEGLAAITKNLDGHPTQEEALRTRFNAMKHGLRAQVATYFPAKPGRYPACATCDVDHDVCREQVACMKRTELFMRHHIAFETRDPGLLTDIRANLHANVQAIIDDMVMAIHATGVEVRAPKWYVDKDGEFRLAEYINSKGEMRLIEEITAHPLLKVLTDFIAKNSLSLSDMNMTPKVQEDEAILRGHLEHSGRHGDTVETFARQSAESLSRLQALIEASHGSRDPVLITQDAEDP
jgi:hypothetical protein